MVEPHGVFIGLDKDLQERMYRYRSLFETQLDDCDIHAIRKATEYEPKENQKGQTRSKSALDGFN